MKTPLMLLGIASLLFISARGVEPSPSVESANRHCKVIQTVEPQYPMRMMREGVARGEVSLVLHVDSNGVLVDHLITGYTRQDFAYEVERVLPKWKFEPAIIAGKPVSAIVNTTVNFGVDGIILVQRSVSEQLMHKAMIRDDEAYRAYSLKELDRLPAPINIVNPLYPQEWAEQGIAGVVQVDFYIDESGKTRLPVVVKAVNPVLAGIAVDAVRQWSFTPPTSKGKPVLVMARQVFTFGKK